MDLWRWDGFLSVAVLAGGAHSGCPMATLPFSARSCPWVGERGPPLSKRDRSCGMQGVPTAPQPLCAVHSAISRKEPRHKCVLCFGEWRVEAPQNLKKEGRGKEVSARVGQVPVCSLRLGALRKTWHLEEDV